VAVAQQARARSGRTLRLAVVLRMLSIGSWVVVIGGAGVGLIARTRVGETQVQNILLVVLAMFFALVLAQLLLAAARASPHAGPRCSPWSPGYRCGPRGRQP